MKTLDSEAARLRAALLANITARLDRTAALLESPAEAAFFWAFLNSLRMVEVGNYSHHWGYRPFEDGGDEVWIEFGSQSKITGGYRLDFVVSVMRHRGEFPWINVDVEIDGHDYHERTKEQAERDKKRDRDLQARGWYVARFTAAEVYRSAEDVVTKLWAFIDAVRNVRQRRDDGAVREALASEPPPIADRDDTPPR